MTLILPLSPFHLFRYFSRWGAKVPGTDPRIYCTGKIFVEV